MEISGVNPEVCVFDSGIGGISLLYECAGLLPRVNFTYFADNARMPYGSLPRDVLLKYVEESFDRIEKLNPSAAIAACNTVTAQCIDYLREKYSFNIIGIQPAVKPAAARGGRCVVLATPSTAASASLKKLIDSYGRGSVEVFACPDLARYIEQNIYNLTEEGVRALLPNVKADSVVLGCTHYIFAEEIIRDYYNCPVFDGIVGTGNRLAEILGNFDHSVPRAQKIAFCGGDEVKNRRIFNMLLRKNGGFSPFSG